MTNGNGHEDEGKIATEKVAQHLANLMGKPVAGKVPDPIYRDDPRTEEILVGLLNGDISPGAFTQDADSIVFSVDAPFIIISGLLNGPDSIRQLILMEVDVSLFRSKFLEMLFNEVKLISQDGDPTKEKVLDIRDRIPGLWQLAGNDPLEGRLKMGVYYRWIQIERSECSYDLVSHAIQELRNKKPKR